MLHLQKRLLPLLRAATHPTTPAVSSPCFPLQRHALLSAVAAAAPFSVEEYLIGACGLTRAQALRASKRIPRLKSASNPDAVLALLSGIGLSRAEIAAVVAGDPLFLCARVENVAGRIASLRDCVGLPDSQIARFLLAGGAMGLRSCDVAPKLAFWIPFVGSLDALLRIVRRNKRLLNAGIDTVVKPNVALLQECGLSACDIVKLSFSSRLLSFNPARVKDFVRRTDELGVPRASGLFKYALGVAACLSDETVTAKMELLRSTLGCSMEKLCFRVSRNPMVLRLSAEKVLRKIEFLVAEVGLDREYIADRPILLSYSLEKRLVPRHYILKVLEAKGLANTSVGFCKVVSYSEANFVATYIERHKDAVPGLADAYAAACAGNVPCKFDL